MQQAADQIIVPTPRSWERVSRIVKTEQNAEVRQFLLSGIIGEGASVEFFHVVEEIRELPPMETLFRMSPEEARRAFPKSVAGLYGLAYSVTAYCSDLETFRKGILIFNELDEVSSDLPGAEIQTLAMELLMDKAQKLNLSTKVTFSPEYSLYRKKGQQVSHLK